MMENHKMIVENAGLLSIAALKHLNVKNKNIVSVNRNSAVELEVTLEAFGHHHTNAIMKALEEHGYNPIEINTKGTHLL